ncbi:DNA methyltransferase [Bacteroides sp.]
MYKRKIDYRWSYRDANTKEYTHCYHTYPAMMIPQVARSLMSEYRPIGRFELLFDPYMGSGTSLVEASLLGIHSVGTDLNPLARLMAKAKTTHYNEIEIKRTFSIIQSELVFYSDDRVENRCFEHITNYPFWYSEESLLKLSYLSQLIEEQQNNLDFFKIALSEVVREVSFTRNNEFKRFKMSKEKVESFKPDVFRLFEEKVTRNMNGLNQYNSVPFRAISEIFGFDTSDGIPTDILPDGSVDMIVTSPPYGDSRTTVAYGQFSRWANEWFGYENAQNLDNILMGGKKYDLELFATCTIRAELDDIKNIDIKRYYEVVSFLNDYWLSIQNVAQTLRVGGVVCYVVGNRTVKGVQIPLDYFTAEMFEKCGFKHQITIVREIPNKRMPAKTSPTNKSGKKVNTMSHEYLVIMEKVQIL